jgi:inosine-uridine nucleoside N-ribohydrolase
MRLKVLIDCDVGLDDALALILAFHSPELDVKAITGVNGNVPLNLVFKNIQRILSLIRPQNKPLIAQGADRPLRRNPVYAFPFHGRDGLGEIDLEPVKEEYWHMSPGGAGELIPDMARQHPGEMILIAMGPLTNIALGLRRDPTAMRQFKEVVIMGGAVRERGNITPFAEFNFFADPEAAGIVIESGLPITLVPLDVTHQVFLDSEIMERRIRPLNDVFSEFVVKALGYDADTTRTRQKPERFYLHDPLAVGAAIDPTLLKKERLNLSVDTREGDQYGRSTESAGGRTVDVSLEVDSGRFLDLFLSRLSPFRGG